jgi:hypothetical protein
MYYIYDRIVESDGIRYRRRSAGAIFGSRSGFIVRRLRDKAAKGALYAKWHLDVAEELKDEAPNCSIIVDIKPKSTTQLFLCEITDIWGHSFHEVWTSVLLRLKGLLVDAAPTDYQRSEFKLSPNQPSIIYSILYLSGGIKEGGISRTKWLPPGPSSTNSALLWPETLRFFFKTIQDKDPEHLKSGELYQTRS